MTVTSRLDHSSFEGPTSGMHNPTRDDIGVQPGPATVHRLDLDDAAAAGIVVVAANPLFCQALATTLGQQFTVLGTGSTLSEAQHALEQHQPQLSLLVADPPFPHAAFADMCRILVGRHPMTCALLVVRDRRPEDLVLAFQQGAKGLLDLTIGVDQLINGLERLACGEVVMQPEILRDMMQARTPADAPDRDHQRLTAAQTRMLMLLSEGYTSKEIARMVQSSSASVNHHIERASQQLGARHRTEAVARALRLGIIT